MTRFDLIELYISVNSKILRDMLLVLFSIGVINLESVVGIPNSNLGIPNPGIPGTFFNPEIPGLGCSNPGICQFKNLIERF